MPIENHSLINEFPEHKSAIQDLKLHDAHFKKLYEEYHELTHNVEKMEQEIVPSTTLEEEQLKKHRLQLKDTILSYIKSHSAASADA
ncbi:MAG: DUF465 domain-containing protein [Marinomonas hwangdonensis]|nr:DUF465 domain-containing protein [Marinomonas hwangdonensis]